MVLFCPSCLRCGSWKDCFIHEEEPEQNTEILKQFKVACKQLLDASLVLETMYKKLVEKIVKTKNKVLSGKCVWERFQKSKKSITNELLPYLKDLSDVGSGKGLQDAFNEMVCKVYVKEQVVSIAMDICPNSSNIVSDAVEQG